jgi:hypothetical protein
MRQDRHFPSRDRLSVLTAIIVLAYIISRFLALLAHNSNAAPVIFNLNGTALILFLVAALISTGADALIRSHPNFAGRTTFIHWIVPGAAALVLGVGLERLPNGPGWWFGLACSALMLLAVLIAEYIVVDSNDPTRDTAALGLSALTYSLAIILFALLHNIGARAMISATIGGLVAAALAWRLFALNGAPLRRAGLYAAIVGLICAETIWAISYWRVTSSGATLLVMLPFYLGVGLSQQHLTGHLTRRVWIEYGIVGLVALSLALAYIFG